VKIASYQRHETIEYTILLPMSHLKKSASEASYAQFIRGSFVQSKLLFPFTKFIYIEFLYKFLEKSIIPNL